MMSNTEVDIEITPSYYNPAGGCHFGREKTTNKVASRYFQHGQH